MVSSRADASLVYSLSLNDLKLSLGCGNSYTLRWKLEADGRLPNLMRPKQTQKYNFFSQMIPHYL